MSIHQYILGRRWQGVAGPHDMFQEIHPSRMHVSIDVQGAAMLDVL